MLTDPQLLKYSRQIMLPKIDIQGQQKLADSHVVILGIGGLGSPVAIYLTTAGVGEITLIDDDQVDLSNLQRQIVHKFSSIGIDKVESAKQTLLELNPEVKINIINKRLDECKLGKAISQANVVADCCDNFATRFSLNRACYQNSIPLVSGAAIRWEGQLTTFMMTASSACYRCLYDEDILTDQSCAQNGVVGPVVGIIGSMQALDVIKIITGAGSPMLGELSLFDALNGSFNKIKYRKKSNCPVCSSSALGDIG